MARTNGLYAEAVDHVAAMPEYPNTSDKGIAYCVDVTGMDKAMAKELHENVKYYYVSYTPSKRLRNVLGAIRA